jgi:hypothetical protein
MATVKSRQYAAPKFNPGDGRAAYITDSVVNTGALAGADTLEYTIPAGVEVCDLRVLGTQTSAGATVGYQPLVAGEFTGSAAYFGTITIGATGVQLLNFKPIKFERDAKIVITLAAALAAGETTIVAGINALGVK